jgi:hypothetical protein
MPRKQKEKELADHKIELEKAKEATHLMRISLLRDL